MCVWGTGSEDEPHYPLHTELKKETITKIRIKIRDLIQNIEREVTNTHKKREI